MAGGLDLVNDFVGIVRRLFLGVVSALLEIVDSLFVGWVDRVPLR